jgi:hypothetical protein
MILDNARRHVSTQGLGNLLLDACAALRLAGRLRVRFRPGRLDEGEPSRAQGVAQGQPGLQKQQSVWFIG